MIIEIIGYSAAVVMGLVLGLTGSGGAILTVPILVYLFSIDALLATTYSLGIVGATSLVGTVRQVKMGNISWETALSFGLTSVIGVIFARKVILPYVPDPILHIGNFTLSKPIGLLLLFALLMLLAAYKMIKPQQYVASDVQHANHNKVILGIKGLFIGIITGFVGASGGFLIIPVLVLGAKLPMKKAIGTSLFVVMLNCLIGFASSLGSSVHIQWEFISAFTALAVIGIVAGIQYASKVSNEKLKPAFGWFVLIMGVFIITKELLLR
ncbi:MAG: sulfite exporter TauE/SafE family protein [Thermoflexibacteraceae bacterium]|jgi:uncharacterized membrane protein YfcA